MAKAFGWEEYMKYDSSGNEIDLSADGGYANAVKALSDKFDSTQNEFEELYDEYKDLNKELLENADERNRILQEVVDNQVSLENRVLQAIENMRQRAIDEAKDERDAIQESADQFINGLNDSLSKEQQLYNNAQSDNELNRLRRQLAILQRSGGSAAEIRSLQQDIASREQDKYFEAQQQQIDAIEKASQEEMDRLDHQIDIMEETLAYQKDNGLLWEDVYQVMAMTPTEIERFLLENTDDLRSKSELQIAEDLRTIKSEIERWVSNRDDETNPLNTEGAHNWNVYYPAAKNNFNLDDEKDAELISKAKEAYETKYLETGDETKAAAAADEIFAKQKKDRTNNQSTNTSTSTVNSNTTGGTNNNTNTGWGWIQVQHDFGAGSGGKIETVKKQAGTKWSGNSLKTTPPTGKVYWYCNPSVVTVIANKTINITLYYAAQNVVNKNSDEDKKNFKSGTGTTSATTPGAVSDAPKITPTINIGNGNKTTAATVLKSEETSNWLDSIVNGATATLASVLSNVQDTITNIASTNNYSETKTDNSSITIETANVNMNATIASDYDARRAADNVMDEMVRIARKTTAASVLRR